MEYLFESPNERRYKKGTKGHDFFQRSHSPPASLGNMNDLGRQHISTTSTGAKFDTRVSGYINPTLRIKQVYLYEWYLTRVGGDHPENGSAQSGGQVALEGYTTSDLLDHKKFRTACIESRIEKCKLRTVDGLYIQLMGAIDEQCTYDNGFPISVIHFFLTGFPFNWNQVISTCYGRPSLNTSALPASKEKEYAWQEKDETLKSDYSGIHMEDMGTGKSSFLEPKENMSKVEENSSKVTSPRESSVRCSKRGRHGSQPIRSSKRLKCDNLRKKREPRVFSPFVGLLENANVSKESGCKLSLGSDTTSVKTEDTTPEKMYLGTKTHDCFDRDNDLTESGSKLLRKSLNFLVSQEDRDSVKGEKNAMKYHVFRSMKETGKSKKQIDCESLLVEAKSAQTVQSVTKESGGENQTNGHFSSAEDSVHQQIDKNEAEQLATANVHLEQFKNNCTPGEITVKNQIPVSESPDTNCRTGKLISRGRSHTNINGTNKSSQASRGELCSEITEVAVRKMSDAEHATHREKVIRRRALGKECKNSTQSTSNPELGVIPNKIISSRTDGKGQLEADCLATEAVDFDFMQMKEDVLYASEENKASSLPGKHLNNDVNKPVKQVNMSGTKRGEQPKNRTRCTDQPPELSNAFICNHITVKDRVMLKYNDMDVTCGSNRSQVASEIEHGMASKHRTENNSSSLPENYLNSDVNKSVKQVNRSGTKTRGRPKKETMLTYQSPELSKAFMCNQTTANDGVMPKCNDIDATCGTNPYQVASEIEHVMAAKHCTEICDDFIQINEDVLSASAENKSSSLPENYLNSDVNKPVKQVNRSDTKTRGRPKRGTRLADQSPELSKAFVCNQTTVNDGVMLKCNDIDATCGTNPYQVASEIEHGMASKHCTEIDDGFICMKEDVLSASEENKLSALPENYLNNDANKPVKQVHKSDTMRRGSSKNRTRYTDQPRELSKAFVCNQTPENDGVMLKHNDIDATCGTNTVQVASEIKHGMVSTHYTESGDNCRERNGDGEEGIVKTPNTITEINMETQTSKRKLVGKLIPFPPRRVHTTPEEVSKAFGLKISRSGRLLVPPLAHWCNQKVAYDLDRGIIAILDASSQRNTDNDGSNFKPPEHKDAIRIQEKLCNAASEMLRTPKSGKKACKD